MSLSGFAFLLEVPAFHTVLMTFRILEFFDKMRLPTSFWAAYFVEKIMFYAAQKDVGRRILSNIKKQLKTISVN